MKGVEGREERSGMKCRKGTQETTEHAERTKEHIRQHRKSNEKPA